MFSGGIKKDQWHDMGAFDKMQYKMQEPTNCLSAFDHFVGLLLKGLNLTTPGVHAGKHFFKLIFPIVSYSSDLVINLT